ncbi:MAG: inorganic diphosphatase [Alphaproteobacteria bacterium]|nr:inorganic diphosphatase [Alphaproteobacteria bacterium SS10]
MQIERITPGDNPPSEINVVIEVPVRSDPIKYEMDKESGALIVDRILGTSMHYPVNYGFIPNTLSGDGDPVDVMVVCDIPINSGAFIKARPVGVMKMVDDGGEDEKILAVPANSVSPIFSQYKTYKDLPQPLCDQIEHFFSRYKDLEDGKWAKVEGWGGPEEAGQFILDGIKRVTG